MRSKKGFTLIELMIVVAIIGILAAIAIPNFLKFQCKSKQSEARQNLGAIFVAMGSYYSNNDTYPDTATITGVTTPDCWYLMSWSPSGKTRYYYQCGTGNYLNTEGAKRISEPTNRANCDTTMAGKTISNELGFTIAAAGNLDTDTACCDMWGINNAKYIKNRVPEGIADDTNLEGLWGNGMNDCELDTCTP